MAAAISLLSAGAVPGAEPETLSVPLEHGADLGSRLAHGPIIVLAEVLKDGGKARLDVREVVRGSVPRGTLKLDTRQANAVRPLGSPAFKTRKAERAIFVLRPMRDRRENVYVGIFEPAVAGRSKVSIPAEGAPALLEAVRRIVEHQDAPERGLAEARLLDWLVGPNPWLVEYALDQGARFGLAGPDWAVPLMGAMRDPSPWRRLTALTALGEAFARNRFAPQTGFRRGVEELHDEAGDVVTSAREQIVRLARTDPDEQVRVAAVQRIEQTGHSGAAQLLDAISREDTSQTVRYEAAVALRRLQAARDHP